MNRTVEAIKELRESTGAGMMDCKRALEASDGDIERAREALRAQGRMQAKQRKDREANEGRVFVRVIGGTGLMLKLSCETDFVARNRDFIALGDACAAIALERGIDDAKEDMAELVRTAVAKIKENIVLENVRRLETGAGERLVEYVHGEGRIGVILRIRSEGEAVSRHPKYRELENDLALHVAAFAPAFLSRDRIDRSHLDSMEAEFAEEAAALGKPEKLAAGIARGKLEKHLARVCLIEQPYIRDDSITAGDAVRRVAEELESNIEITGFLYDRVLGTGNPLNRA